MTSPLTDHYAAAIVRAILDELKQPSEGMLNAGDALGTHITRGEILGLWLAMLDAIEGEPR